MSQGLCAGRCYALLAGWAGRGLSLMCDILAEIHRRREKDAAVELSGATLQVKDADVSDDVLAWTTYVLAWTANQARLLLTPNRESIRGLSPCLL